MSLSKSPGIGQQPFPVTGGTALPHFMMFFMLFCLWGKCPAKEDGEATQTSACNTARVLASGNRQREHSCCCEESHQRLEKKNNGKYSEFGLVLIIADWWSVSRKKNKSVC